MRFDYWTISVVPEPMSITRLGFGLIVTDPRTGELETFFRDDRLISKIFPAMSFLARSIKNLETELKLFRGASASSLPIAHELTLDGFMRQRHTDWNNAIQISQKESVDAANLKSAVSLLAMKLLGAEQSKPHRTSVYDLRRQLMNTYREFPTLRKLTFQNVDARVGRWNIDLTSAVIEGECVHEINQSFNFDSSSSAEANNRANYWAMKIEKLRNSGGELEHEKEGISVGNTTPVVAFILAPSAEQDQEEFQKTLDFFRDVDIEVKSRSTIQSHAAALERRIA